MRYRILLFAFALVGILLLATATYQHYNPPNLEWLVKPRLLNHVDTTRVFFRDDDVSTQDGRVDRLIELFIEKEVPLALGVIPTQVDDYNVEQLNELQSMYPSLIEIDMHAYSHERIGASVEGEFKHRRRMKDVQSELLSGKGLMDQYFTQWSGIFTVPFSAGDNQLIHGLGDIGFSGISIHHEHNNIPKVDLHYPGLLDHSTCVDPVKDWSVDPVVYRTKEEIADQYLTCKHNGKVVGIMLHHLPLQKEEHWELISWLIDYVKEDTVDIVRMQDIYS